MLSFIDDFLNRITMYRLVLYYLIVLLGVAFVLSLFGAVSFAPQALIVSILLILAVCWGVNIIFASVSGAATNVESVYITALILALIVPPTASFTASGAAFLVFASAWAIASKYIFAIGKKHIFNPAAFGVVVSSIFIGASANWWVTGSLWLLPFVFLGGLLIVRKIRRFDTVFAFFIAVIAATLVTTAPAGYLASFSGTFLRSSIFFLAFVMLTEPLTMPPGRFARMTYGALVGILFAPNVNIAGFYFTPELALLLGNVFAYIMSPKGRFMLTLVEKKLLGTGIYEFAFASDRPFSFQPGQYLEWTLPHEHPDNRGNRRYFTIASSPTETETKLGVRFYEPSSSFKRALLAMEPGGMLSASHLAGTFVLPRDPLRKVAFIAGGIGVTPFRSMVQHLLDTKERRDAVLLYSNRTALEISYSDVFERARQELSMKTVYVLTNEPQPVPGAHQGPIDAELIRAEIPDYRERTFYISGSHGMVESFRKTLREMGVPRWRIKIDFFPGFV